jgi:hypothetical protein
MKTFPKFIYRFWPYVLRTFEFFFHHHRQDFLIGHLSPKKTAKELQEYLKKEGYELGIIALKDPGEILNMRKREGGEFQYHLRLYKDREIRTHYEYAAEAHPITHCFKVKHEAKTEHFKALLKGYLE